MSLDPGDVLKDVVERPMPDLLRPIAAPAASPAGAAAVGPMLRPIQATVGVAFPRVQRGKHYGLPAEGVGALPLEPPMWSAHVQPEDAANPMRPHAGVTRAEAIAHEVVHGAGMVPPDACGSATQAEDGVAPIGEAELASLRSGHWPASSDPGVASPTAAAYVELLLRFLRSPVGKHRQLALDVLRERLGNEPVLKSECLHRGNVATLVQLIASNLTAGHVVVCDAAAASLLALLYDEVDEIREVVAEVGCPSADQEGDDDDDDGTAAARAGSDAYTVAELAEMLRGDDVPRALEQLGVRRRVAMSLALITHARSAALLLCGLTPSGAVALSADPACVAYLTSTLQAVVSGTSTLGAIQAELMLLRKIMDTRRACLALLRDDGFREVFTLLISTTSILTADSYGDAVSATCVFLALRACVRHGNLDVIHSVSGTLIACLGVGGLIPLEMAMLCVDGDGDVEINELVAEAAHAALHRVERRPRDGPLVGESTGPSTVLVQVAHASALHFLASFVTLQGPAALSLGSSTSETHSYLGKLLAASVLTPEGLASIFVRLGRSPRATTVPGAAAEAALASLNHGRVRMAAAVARVDPATRDMAAGYMAAVIARFWEACLETVDVRARMRPDELCTAIEAITLLHEAQDTKAATIGACFTLHAVALSRHCLDAAAALVDLLCPQPQFSDCLRARLLAAVEAKPGAESAANATPLWSLQPLLVAESAAEVGEWCLWMRHTFGLHQRVKDVLGWDMALARLLLWAAAHKVECVSDFAAHANISALLLTLSDLALREGDLPRRATELVVTSLSAFSEVHAEVAVPAALHVALCIMAAVVPPSAAVILLQHIVGHARVVEADASSTGEAAPTLPWPQHDHAIHALWNTLESWVSRHTCGTASASEGRDVQTARDAWGLNDVVAVLQVVGPVWSRSKPLPMAHGTDVAPPTSSMKSYGCWPWLVVHGILEHWVLRRCRANGGALTRMEQVVLTATLDELDWHPAVLERHLHCA